MPRTTRGSFSWQGGFQVKGTRSAQLHHHGLALNCGLAGRCRGHLRPAARPTPHPAVPTIRFQVLYVFLVLAHERRRILHFNVTAHPTAEWTAQQLRNAFPWDSAPRYLLRDRDRIFGDDFTRQVQDMGMEHVLSAPRSPWQRPTLSA